jgi:hypothetical protein
MSKGKLREMIEEQSWHSGSPHCTYQYILDEMKAEFPFIIDSNSKHNLRLKSSYIKRTCNMNQAKALIDWYLKWIGYQI